MTDGQTVWLAVIAISVAIMAVTQVLVLIQAAKLARQAGETLQTIRRDLQPLIQKIDRVADEAGRLTALAAVQLERVDYLLATTVDRVDSALAVVQDALVQPLRRGSALVTAIRTGWALFRGWQDRGTRMRREDEDALFVG